MKREHQDSNSSSGMLPPPPSAKSRMFDEDCDAGVDELLAALGYKVRSSDMADVAQKLEQLEMVMGTSAATQDDVIVSHLASDIVHYNPSDINTWVDSMLSELNAPPPPPPVISHPSSFDFAEPSSITTDGGLGSGRDRKRMRTVMTMSAATSSPSSSVTSSPPPPLPPSPPPSAATTTTLPWSLPVVVVDPHQAGIRLVHTLMACAEAVQQENYKIADSLVKQISFLAASQGGAMGKVAGYFAEALARRIYQVHPQPDSAFESAFSDILHMHFYESCPYLKFAHFTANQAILEAFSGFNRVHVIDFSMKQGMQWPALMQALALRPGGPPSFRLTGIGPPQSDNTDALQQVGWKLAQLADMIHVDFEYRGFIANSLSDPELIYFLENQESREDEAIAVNSVFELHKLLARPGAIETVLSTVEAIRPKIMTVVEQEANHNHGSFTERFGEALHYYSSMFDSLDSGCIDDDSKNMINNKKRDDDLVMSEVYLGREICNVIGCEGSERVERHENWEQWRTRFQKEGGFEGVSLGSNAYKQASMLLAAFAGGDDGYRVEEREGCLTLGWHARPLIATSAWRLAQG